MDREIIALHITLDQGQCRDLFLINAIDMQMYYFLLRLPFYQVDVCWICCSVGNGERLNVT